MGLRQFFPTGTYAGIGTTCVEFEIVMKSAKKKSQVVPEAYLKIGPRDEGPRW